MDLEYNNKIYVYSPNSNTVCTTVQGVRKNMLDDYYIYNDKNYTLYVVVDGHGPDGEYVIRYIKNYTQYFKKSIENNINNIDLIAKNILIDIEQLNNNLLIEYNKNKFINGGSTLLMLIILDTKLLFINIGDTRAYYFTYVDKNFVDLYKTPIHRNGYKNSQVIGDFHIKNNLKPHFEVINKIPYSYVFITTDGLWEYFNPFPLDEKKCENNNLGYDLVKTAIDNGSKDNILVLIIRIGV